MRLVAFSDTHNKHKQITLPECDIAIFAGDATSYGYKDEVQRFLKWYNSQSQCKHKIFIAGNHDRSFDVNFIAEYEKDLENFDRNKAKGKPGWLLEFLDRYNDVIYLENSDTIIEGVKIWGSPITPRFGKRWAFNADRFNDIQYYWDKIPDDTDIVVTHGPTYGKLDYVPEDGEFTGCLALDERLRVLKPSVFICGHIHSGRGIYMGTDTFYINASIMDNSYEKQGEPMIFKYDVEKKRIDIS